MTKKKIVDSFVKSLKNDGFSVSEKGGRLYIYMQSWCNKL